MKLTQSHTRTSVGKNVEDHTLFLLTSLKPEINLNNFVA
jgi:hypothetical protein